MCIFHRWGKWKQYEVELPIRAISKNWYLSAAIEYRQKKRCLKCGKIKDELVYLQVT